VGHGSRYLWELGDRKRPRPETFFEREDVQRLAPRERFPVVLSISCATAPFDHPNADSLGEAMVLTEDRGAIAFLGAGATLFTPQRFGEQMILELGKGKTVGEAMVLAKRHTRKVHISHLYNLLGDPALPLR
jgi:hypothetical protein